MNDLSNIPVRIPTIHDIWEAEEAALDARQEHRQAHLNAMADECDRAWEAAAPQREREAARKQAIADEQFAQLSRQFLRLAGEPIPAVLREGGK